MAKALAVRTLFLIIVIGLIMFFSLIVFWHYLSIQVETPTRVSCNIKLQNYCMRCVEKGECPMDWDTINPPGCEEFEIVEPNLEDCQDMYPTEGE